MEIEQSLDDRFVEELAKSIDSVFEDMKSVIQNCVISGTRKSLSSKTNANKVATLLDTSDIISDNTLVVFVRGEIEKAGNKIIYNFAETLSNLIHKLLEEI